MKSILTRFLAIILACSIFGCSATSHDGAQFVGQQAPLARITLLDGTAVSLQQYYGKTVALIFWATTCSKSKQALPRIAEFAEKFVNRSDVIFLATSLDKLENLDELKNRIGILHSKKIQYAFSGNEANDEAFQIFDGGEIPYFIVIEPKGKVIAAGLDDRIIYQTIH